MVVAATGKHTVWFALLLYRAATWRGASANGRKAAAFTLRATARMLKPNAPALPTAARAYLDRIAFRGAAGRNCAPCFVGGTTRRSSARASPHG